VRPNLTRSQRLESPSWRQGIIRDPDDPKQVAEFIKGTTRVDKKVLGEFISKKGNEKILNAFISLFDFTGQRLDEALRQLLHSFRLPGESALIERIIADFSDQYVRMAEPEGITDKDAIYVLTYAVIMLNTDQHNPNLKSAKRMQYEDFAKNLRGVNQGKDFDPEYLRAMYESIKSREIILPEEHNDRHAYDHAWKELIVKVQSTSDLVICDTNIFDADMFAATWKPIVATLSYVFMSATDDAVFSRVVLGFDQCAQIAAKYNLTDALDRIISCLAYISTLAPDVPPSTSLNTEVQADKKSVMVSETAVRFGRDGRAQLATVVLFQVIKGNEASIRDGWNHVSRASNCCGGVLMCLAYSHHGQPLRQLFNTSLLLVLPKDACIASDTFTEPSSDHRPRRTTRRYRHLCITHLVCIELRKRRAARAVRSGDRVHLVHGRHSQGVSFRGHPC
tara:strand:+ start:15214 stop:16563 length:1350 start_codon:yes stop_codon:yes gene_type:complete